MEILKKDMRERKFSDKINYSVLSNLDVEEGAGDVINKEPIEITDEDSTTDSKAQIINR